MEVLADYPPFPINHQGGGEGLRRGHPYIYETTPAGRHGRLIIPWSKVRVLPGPPLP